MPIGPRPTFILKDCLDILLPSITKLANYSVIDGSLRRAFKRVVVTPLSLKRFLCPETTLRIISQYLVFVSCQSWLSELSTLCHTSSTTHNPHKFAYKPGHSTKTALLSIINLVLLNLSAVFDTIDHNILLG